MSEESFDQVQFDGDTDSSLEDKIAETFESLYQQPVSELRLLYQKEFKVAIKGNDKKKMAQKLAEHIVKKSTSGAKSSGITQSEAEAILVKARAALVETETLTVQKSQAMTGFNKKLTACKEKMKEAIFKSTDAADVRLEQVEAAVTLIDKLEGKKKTVADEFAQKIGDAKQTLKDTLTSIRQPSLFDGDGADAKN